MSKSLLLLAVFCVFLSANFVSASSCTEQSFDNSCKCVAEGGENCWESGKSLGMACMWKEHPIATSKYFLDDCPSLKRCVDNLQGCISAYCTGSDAEKCENVRCKRCHTTADSCADAAVSCNDCGNGVCDKDNGETQENCCLDCGCPGVWECHQFLGSPSCTDPASYTYMCLNYGLLPLLTALGAVALKIAIA